MLVKIQKAFLGGIVGTAAMSVFMLVSPMIGLPKMNPPQMISTMLEAPNLIGWSIHFLLGIIFALVYVFFFMRLIRRVNLAIFKGLIFGTLVFIFAQIVMGVMGDLLGGMPLTEGNVAFIMLGSILGHMIYGLSLVFLVKDVA